MLPQAVSAIGAGASVAWTELARKEAVIMLVDDEPTTLDVLQMFLEEAGYENFVAVTDSRQALGLLRSRRPDVLLLDLMMPEVGGFDILSSMRADPDLVHVPVIMLTSSTDAQTKLTALELGATDFLGKPVDPSELALRLRNTLAAKAYQDRLAYYDRLTGLPNRQLFSERLERTLWRAQQESSACAVMHLDLDRFQQINDSLGHTAGDGLLKAVAQRLESTLAVDWDSDRESVFLARVGGDEFSMILTGFRGPDHAIELAERIRAALGHPFTLGEREFFVSASLGVAVFPEDGPDRDTLMRHAGIATSHAKQRGDKSYQFYSSGLNARAMEYLSLESQLHKAIERGELVLHYQPKICTGSGRITGAEALVRWHHPEHGTVSPATFIPIAEESGLIIPIGEWVLHRACEQLRAWTQAGYGHLQMAVNVSTLQFRSERLLEIIEQALRGTGLDGRHLTIELTESVLMCNARGSARTLEEIRALGPKVSVDDFGTGYSSLSYLKRFAIDELKIDRSFVRDIPQDPDNSAIVTAVIAMAHGLGLSVVAEGVETEAQLAFLRERRCDQFQGFLVGRPTEATRFVQLLERFGVE
jgi:diguanylate cyclase (GGDEF)-like protein